MSDTIFDNIVVGSGMAGLLNAVFSAASGKRVKLITAGAGSVTVGSGLIDVLGYSTVGGLLKKPSDGFSTLEADHPYMRCGGEVIAKALKAFLHICDRYGYPYLPEKGNRLVPTALGRLKPSCLVPRTMDMESLKEAEIIYVVGIDGMKDFSPKMICDGFSVMELFRGKRFVPLSIPLREQGFRDFSAMDMARFMDGEEGCSRFIGQLKGHVNLGQGIIMPPILGSGPDYHVYERVKSELNAEVCETLVIPPAVTGYRLRAMLINVLGKLNVEIVENAKAVSAEVRDGRCLSVNTYGPGGLRRHTGRNFTIATGGFYGGGITSSMEKAREAIFGLTIKTADNWASPEFKERQACSRFGVTVNDSLNACDVLGAPIYENVYFAGRVIAGADSPYEHSGNGVALATSYLAASVI